jgi:hypothetical protein
MRCPLLHVWIHPNALDKEALNNIIDTSKILTIEKKVRWLGLAQAYHNGSLTLDGIATQVYGIGVDPWSAVYKARNPVVGRTIEANGYAA